MTPPVKANTPKAPLIKVPCKNKISAAIKSSPASIAMDGHHCDKPARNDPPANNATHATPVKPNMPRPGADISPKKQITRMATSNVRIHQLVSTRASCSLQGAAMVKTFLAPKKFCNSVSLAMTQRAKPSATASLACSVSNSSDASICEITFKRGPSAAVNGARLGKSD